MTKQDWTEFNIPLAANILAIITNEPELHNQGDWVDVNPIGDPDAPDAEWAKNLAYVLVPKGDLSKSERKNLCGTPHCVAGWAMELSGTPIRTSQDEYTWGDVQRYANGEWVRFGVWGENDSILHLAAKELGLTAGKALELFSGGNTNDDAKRILVRYIKKAAKVQYTDRY